MDEAGSHVARRQLRGPLADEREQADRILGIVGYEGFVVEILERVSKDPVDRLRVLEEGLELEGPDPDMAVA
jgi:hypothetical protein